MTLMGDLKKRLRKGGWKLLRQGKHAVWLHPVTRKTLTIPGTVKDVSCKRQNYLKQIAQGESLKPKEKKPKVAVEIPKVLFEKKADRVERILQKARESKDKDLENSIPWWVLFRDIRASTRVPREAVCKALGWPTGKLRRLEEGKLEGITEQEFFTYLKTSKYPEELQRPLFETGSIPIIEPKKEPAMGNENTQNINREDLVKKVQKYLQSPRISDAEAEELTKKFEEHFLEMMVR